MDPYPSVISTEGSAERNIRPLIDVLEPLLTGSRSEGGSNSGPPRRILELASFPYLQIEAFARAYGHWDWWGSVRDQGELSDTEARLRSRGTLSPNLRPPRILDIAMEDHWRALGRDLVSDGAAPLDGVLMVNLIHCCPLHLPEEVFRQLSPRSDDGKKRLNPTDGFVAAYAPFLNDDGSYKSEGDRKFEHEHIKKTDPSLGLRTIPNITAMAVKQGFREESRVEMPKGNMFVVWRVVVPA
ncbi:hypothetical protein IAU60_000999 [Kwoniella sp. DSM 27419]